MFEKVIAKQFFKTLEKLEFGQLTVVTPEQKTFDFKGPKAGTHATLILHDWKVIKNLATKGDIGFTEDYRDGLWETPNLTDLLLTGMENETALASYFNGNLLSVLASKIKYMFRSNTLDGSKKNIHAHYDLGNEFYSLWLDPTMTYSAGIFADESTTLEASQHAKYDRIIDRLNSQGGNILEVGCGWGGFAERATQRGDFAVKGITLSEEQHAYATKRLGDKAEIVIEDYRLQEGQYDHIVSIEMFEAVGERFWPTYFSKMKSLLKPDGKAVVQTITIANDMFDEYRRGDDMIRTFIFPGGMLPSPKRFEEEATKAGLKITDTFEFGLDYATTLEYWLETFEQKLDQIRALGFDEAFIRIWRFYLAACIASFKIKRTDVIQVELQHA